MNENRNKTISVIYLACGIVCALRAILNLLSGNAGAAVIRLGLCVLFIILFVIYRRKS